MRQKVVPEFGELYDLSRHIKVGEVNYGSKNQVMEVVEEGYMMDGEITHYPKIKTGIYASSEEEREVNKAICPNDLEKMMPGFINQDGDWELFGTDFSDRKNALAFWCPKCGGIK